MKLKQKQEEKEQKRTEKSEACLYTIIKVSRDEDLGEQMTFTKFKEEVAKAFGVPVQFQRYWLWAERKNHTYRPYRTLTAQEEIQPVGQLREVSNKENNAELKLFLEVELCLDLRPFPPQEKIKEDVLLFFKLYDPLIEKIRYVGRLFVKESDKPLDVLTKINELAGFLADEEIELFEIGDGDIICFQKSIRNQCSEQYRFPEVPSYLDYVLNRQVCAAHSYSRVTEKEQGLDKKKWGRRGTGTSDVSGAVLIPIKLVGVENYSVWSRSMRIALLGKMKIGFVTGACSKEMYREELHEQWETCNAIILSWLISSISVELLNGIVYATNAHEVWEDLKERFDKVNRMRLYQLHREINTLSQGTNSVATYYTNLKGLWNEYDAMVPAPSCECPKSKDYADHLSQLRLMQFLGGLNNSYDQARRQILLKGVTPTLNQVYAMIAEDELQQLACASVTSEKLDLVAMQSAETQTGIRTTKGRSVIIVISMDTLEKIVTSQSALTSCEGHKEVNNAVLAKGQGFTVGEYKQIMELLNKDQQDLKQVNMSDILQLKFETIVVIKDFLLMIKTQFGTNVKVIRTDDGTEFLNN
ncbi:putative isoleucine N-monooxygenase 1-like [Capsicum annuum]|nr:putative isoleucine N-monooxygenase 1-like [Capsicum annuum]